MKDNEAKDGSESKQFESSEFHGAHKGQKCSRWQHGQNPPNAVKCRVSGGKHLGACAEHSKQMTKGKSVNLSEAVFFAGRRTPEIVSDGAKPKKGGAGTKAGAVVKRRKLSADEQKKIRGGKWLRVRKDGKKPGQSGYLGGPSKGPDANKKKNLSQDEDRDLLIQAAMALSVHGSKYSAEERDLIRSRIRSAAEYAGVSINLANDDQASDFGNNTTGAGNNNDGKKSQAGKTRAQPRPFGGRFGKKGSTNGEQAQPGANPDPETFVATVNNLQIGQSVALPNNAAKVKRLGSGYQLVKMDGSENTKVKTLQEATNWVRNNVKLQPKKGVPASNDLNPPSNR